MRSTWRTLLAALDTRTTRDIALVVVADVLVGASFGAIAVGGGLPLWVPVLLSLVVFAGGSQFAAVGVVLAGGSAAAAVAAGLVLNARLLPFGFAVADVLGERWTTRLVGAHVITDESTAFALRSEQHEHRRASFWVSGLALFVFWNLAVVVGALGGRLISDTDVLGLDAAFPAVLLALVLPSLKGRATQAAAVVGAVVAIATTPYLPPGLPVLVALVGLALTLRKRVAP